ncbi:hypothetical protein BN77_3320 [Rhizobium mesoamericanum STM3625]|uniref:Uncharacterized protein n=1 Tax=Rhizobium mesoamericanum STM3625 TaxID=1211777 RepID=K0PXP9_9HYPH|nr:hypothetical protein BN77_3320 [Rhizobium mesoamericanum STM3625]
MHTSVASSIGASFNEQSSKTKAPPGTFLDNVLQDFLFQLKLTVTFFASAKWLVQRRS